MTLGEPWTAADYVVIDVEGNGARPPELVEVAVVPIQQGIVGHARTWLVRPATSITWQARKVHGISDDEVADAPTIEDVAEDVLAAVGEVIVVGHAVHVDIDVLSRALPGWRPPHAIDTLRLARRAFDLPSYSLGALVGHRRLDAGLPREMRPHRADYDATVTARLLVDLVTTLEPGRMTLDTLLQAGAAGSAQSSSMRAADIGPTLFDLLRPPTMP